MPRLVGQQLHIVQTMLAAELLNLTFLRAPSDKQEDYVRTVAQQPGGVQHRREFIDPPQIAREENHKGFTQVVIDNKRIARFGDWPDIRSICPVVYHVYS